MCTCVKFSKNNASYQRWEWAIIWYSLILEMVLFGFQFYDSRFLCWHHRSEFENWLNLVYRCLFLVCSVFKTPKLMPTLKVRKFHIQMWISDFPWKTRWHVKTGLHSIKPPDAVVTGPFRGDRQAGSTFPAIPPHLLPQFTCLALCNLSLLPMGLMSLPRQEK